MKMIKLRYKRLKVIGKWLLALGVLATASYPIIIYPMIDPDPYKEMQKIGRKDLVQEDIQPGSKFEEVNKRIQYRNLKVNRFQFSQVCSCNLSKLTKNLKVLKLIKTNRFCQRFDMRVWSDPFARRKEKMVEDGKQGIFFKGF